MASRVWFTRNVFKSREGVRGIPDLDQDAGCLVVGTRDELLQVGAAIGHDEYHEELVLWEAVHRVVLADVQAVPGMPLLHQSGGVPPPADAHPVRLDKAASLVGCSLTYTPICILIWELAGTRPAKLSCSCYLFETSCTV